MANPTVVNVADILKRISSSQTRSSAPQSVVISGQARPVVNQLCGAFSSSSATAPTATPSRVFYNYKVKIINPVKRSDVIVRHLNNYSGKFDTVMTLRLKLIDAFPDQVPNTVDFSVGYYEGR